MTERLTYIVANTKGTRLVPFVLTSSYSGGRAWRLDHTTRLDALGTHLNPARSAVYQDPCRLQVGMPTAFCPIVGFADVVARDRAFSTDIANACHCSVYHRSIAVKTSLQGSDGRRHHQALEGIVRWQLH